MTENIKKLQELLDCEVIPVAPNTDPKQLVETYLNLWKEGKEQKFTPVIVTADDILLEKFEIDFIAIEHISSVKFDEISSNFERKKCKKFGLSTLSIFQRIKNGN